MTPEERKEKLQFRDPAQILNGWKEVQKREEFFYIQNAKKKFIELEKKIEDKNTYLGQTKIPEVNAYDLLLQKEADLRKMREIKKVDTEFCKKCPAFKNHCPHKQVRPLIKEKYSYPIISSSTYGWLPDLDKFKENYKINKATKNFYDTTHL